jgi:hypothetical protein
MKPASSAQNEKPSFWTTLPGILTAVAGLITALTAFFALFYHPGQKPDKNEVAGRAVDPPSISPVSAARSFLTFTDDGDYDGSWDHSSVQLQESVDKFNWRKWFTEVRQPLGAPKDRTVMIVKPWKTIDKHTYWSQVDFKTHFQTDTQRIESIVLCAIDGASPSVSAYALSEKRDASGGMIVIPSP